MISHHLQIHLVSKLYEIERFGEVETEIMSCGMYSIINWRELIRLFQRSLSVYNIFVVVRIIISYIDLTCVKLVIISNIWWFRQISYGYWMYIFFPAILSRFHNSEIIWNVLIFFYKKKQSLFCNILIRTRDGHYPIDRRFSIESFYIMSANMVQKIDSQKQNDKDLWKTYTNRVHDFCKKSFSWSNHKKCCYLEISKNDIRFVYRILNKYRRSNKYFQNQIVFESHHQTASFRKKLWIQHHHIWLEKRHREFLDR